jgi:hypothetical protein
MPSEDELDALRETLHRDGKYLDDAYFLFFANGETDLPQLAGMPIGLYDYSADSKRMRFKAGSYTGYSLWREKLCDFALKTTPEAVWAEPAQFEGKPFFELINFTDCDGRIGTAVAAKLSQDFRAHADLAEDFDLDGSFMNLYDDFTKAFSLAADSGAVSFC